VYPNQKVAAVAVAKRIADLIRSKNDRGEQTLLPLSLPTAAC